MEWLIGAGGWAYFTVPGMHPLHAYSKAFNFVEVNSTFYEIPPLKLAASWRRMVPEKFVFSVRAHKSITHEPERESLAYENFERIKRICRELKAEVIHMQIPPQVASKQNIVEKLKDFSSSAKSDGIRIAIELRGIPSGKIPEQLLKTMAENSVIHCVDISKGEEPAYKSDILYARLFGKGFHNIYQQTDKELLQIYERATGSGCEKAMLCFHFVKMYKDAARLKVFTEKGFFPKVTRSTGLESFKEVLMEDAKFPATKTQLIKSQGWKVFDLTDERRVRAEHVLKLLPDKVYGSLAGVMEELKGVKFS
jgi:uncharacterized protein YecE (DUF72 family)